MHLHSWNAGAMTRKTVTGGLYINWKMDNPAITNAVTAGPDGNPQHNHDPQVDLYYLTSLAEYHQLHPNDHSFDSDTARMIPLVVADFKAYNVPKGWLYFYLLKDGQMVNNADLVNEAHSLAGDFFTKWYDPSLGFVYDRNHSPADYAVDHALMCGAALIDAGQRWNMPAWVGAGTSTVNHILSVAIDPRFHQFYNSMLVKKDGHDVPENLQAKPSTQGQADDAVITAYTLTHNTHYLDVAGQILQSLFNSPLWDTARGGFYFAIDMSNGALLNKYKETRSQFLVLLALHHFNQARAQLTQQEQALTTVIVSHFYQSTYHGFFYRVQPNFQPYISNSSGSSHFVEDYFTTEAMGGAMDALQSLEMP